MRQVHCDGCGFTEPDGLPKSKRTIESISVVRVKDHRFPEGTDKYEADLCQNCIGMVLHTYFKIPAEGKLDIPAFLGPEAVAQLHPTPEPLASRRAD